MSDPYVPSGKEFDEGAISAAKPQGEGRLKRRMHKLTRRGKQSTRVHQLRTTIADGVGERLPRAARRITSLDEASRQDESTAEILKPVVKPASSGQGAKQAPTRPAAKRQSAKGKSREERSSRHSAFGQGAQLGIDAHALLILLTAEGDLSNPRCRAALAVAIEKASQPRVAAAALQWLLDVTCSGGPSDVPAELEGHLTGEALAVLHYLSKSLDGDRLGAYRAACDQGGTWTQAMRDLDRAAKRYPSLKGMAAELRAGRLHPNWVQSVGGNDSPALKHCRQEILAAHAAHRASPGGGSGSEMPLWPGSWGGPDSGPEHDVLCAVVSRIADRPTATRVVRRAQRAVTEKVGSSSEALAFVRAHGLDVAGWPTPTATHGKRAKRIKRT